MGSAVVVIVHGVGVAPRLHSHDALAAGLVPGVLLAPVRDVCGGRSASAVAGGALAGGTVGPSAGVGQEEMEEEAGDQDLVDH